MERTENPNETILVVDDDPEIINIMGAILSKSGYRIFSAQDGSECIEKIKTFEPNLVLLDIGMQQMDGIEICAALKNDPETKDIPIIFVTGYTDINTLKIAFDAGATDYVCKPINRIELLSRINSVLSHQKLDQVRWEREKLVGILEMAGAVCHELDQPLKAVSLDLNSIFLERPTTDEIYEFLQKFHQKIDKMGEITGKLMRITKYETRNCIRGQKISDIDKASRYSE